MVMNEGVGVGVGVRLDVWLDNVGGVGVGLGADFVVAEGGG